MNKEQKEQLELLADGEPAVEDLIQAADAILEDNDLEVEAEDIESFVAGIEEVLETYELPEEAQQQLSEIIGTLAAGYGAYKAGKALYRYLTKKGPGRTQKWSQRSLLSKGAHRLLKTGAWKREKQRRKISKMRAQTKYLQARTGLQQARQAAALAGVGKGKKSDTKRLGKKPGVVAKPAATTAS